jgi:hypothetical protein
MERGLEIASLGAQGLGELVQGPNRATRHAVAHVRNVPVDGHGPGNVHVHPLGPFLDEFLKKKKKRSKAQFFSVKGNKGKRTEQNPANNI